jgi:phosphoesterase RecJ-like protein
MNPKQTAQWLAEHDNFLILTHRRPDGDTIGCASALADGLRQAGKNAYILPNPDITDKYRPFADPYWCGRGYEPETVVTVDIASFGLFPSTGAKYENSVELCIDHHPSNTHYAKNECIDGTCAACGEIVYEILMALNGGLSKQAADALYAAISSDSGCFAFANTTANTLKTAAQLVQAGADNRELNRVLFRTKSKGRIKIEGMIMSGIRFFYSGKVAIITITRQMMAEAGVTENDMDDIAAIPGSVEGVLVGITVKEFVNADGCKVSVRTGPQVNANELCAKFGGGGHAMASGCSMDVTVEEMISLLVKALGDNFPGEQP